MSDLRCLRSVLVAGEADTAFRNNLCQKLQLSVLKLAHLPRFDSCAPAHLRLVRFPACSLLSSEFYLLCRFSQKAPSDLSFAQLCSKRPRCDIVAPTLVTLPSMKHNCGSHLIPFAQLYLGCARSARPLPAALPAMSHSLYSGDVMANDAAARRRAETTVAKTKLSQPFELLYVIHV